MKEQTKKMANCTTSTQQALIIHTQISLHLKFRNRKAFNAAHKKFNPIQHKFQIISKPNVQCWKHRKSWISVHIISKTNFIKTEKE